MQGDDGSPFREEPNHFDDVVNNELSVYDVYAEMDDEDENGEGDDEPTQVEDGQPLVRTPIPWFSEVPENYEVDQYWAESGSHTSFVPGGEFEKGMYFESKKLLASRNGEDVFYSEESILHHSDLE